MGFDINGRIHTTLDVKEVAYICSAISVYLETVSNSRNNQDVRKDMERIAGRLFSEMYGDPKNGNDFTKKD